MVKVKRFTTPETLAKFCNDMKLNKSNIISIISKDNKYVLFYIDYRNLSLTEQIENEEEELSTMGSSDSLHGNFSSN